MQPRLGALPHASGMRARGPVLSIGLEPCFPRRGVVPQLFLVLGVEVVEQWWNRHGVVLLHGEVPCSVPPSLEARPTVSGYAQNQHEILRMLRNHHAHPPTHIPETARTCMRAGGGATQHVVDALVSVSERPEPI